MNKSKIKNEKLTDDQIDGLVEKLYKNFKNTRWDFDFMHFDFNEDGYSEFNLTIESEDLDTCFDVKYDAPTVFYKELLKEMMDKTEFIEMLSKQFVDKGKNPEDEADFINKAVERDKTISFSMLETDIGLLIHAFHIVFRQAAKDVDFLHQKLRELHLEQMKSLFSSALNESKNRPSPKFSRKEAVNNAAKEYADYQKKVGKESFLKAANLLRKDPANRKYLFAMFYDSILHDWNKAKKLYTANKKFDTWREIIADRFNEFPTDLIERFESADKMQRSPGAIAFVHAGRLCGIPEAAKSTYSLYLKESREWLKKHSVREVEELRKEYDLPDVSRLNEIDLNVKGVM